MFISKHSPHPHKVPESTERELPRHEIERRGLLCHWVDTAFVGTVAPSTQEHKNIILKKKMTLKKYLIKITYPSPLL